MDDAVTALARIIGSPKVFIIAGILATLLFALSVALVVGLELRSSACFDMRP